MSEQFQPNISEQSLINAEHERGMDRYVQLGLQKAVQEHGFDLSLAINANTYTTPEGTEGNSTERISKQASVMAEEAGLNPSFFESPAKTILWLAIADSWTRNEDRSSQEDAHDWRYAEEREMLGDLSLMLAGNESAVVRDLATQGNELASRYITDLETESAARKERDAFLESLVDEVRSTEVTRVLSKTGPNSFLEEQRSMLGVTKETEAPFVVKVLGVADSIYELKDAGTFEFMDYPDWPDRLNALSEEEKQKLYVDSKTATDYNEAIKEKYLPVLDAAQEYEKRFKEQFGPVPVAFIRSDKNPRELYIRMSHADTLLNYFEGGKELPTDNFKQLENKMAIIRHEYGHTQKSLLFGAHNQLGLHLEERKAETVSGDKQGYQDVKYLFRDMSRVSSVDLLDILQSGLLDDDPLGHVLSKMANAAGLRDTLLLMASKPLPYEKNPDHAKEFASLRCLRSEGDVSSLDGVLNDSIERRGKELFAKNVGKSVIKLLQ